MLLKKKGFYDIIAFMLIGVSYLQRVARKMLTVLKKKHKTTPPPCSHMDTNNKGTHPSGGSGLRGDDMFINAQYVKVSAFHRAEAGALAWVLFPSLPPSCSSELQNKFFI